MAARARRAARSQSPRGSLRGAIDPRGTASRGRAAPAGGLLARPAPAPRRPALPTGSRSTWTARPTRSAPSGCRRLVHWRFERPPADAEALFFGVRGRRARASSSGRPGAERTPGPGDEAQVSAQAVYFRRGPVLVRVFLDPGASPPPATCSRAPDEIDRALLAGGSR